MLVAVLKREREREKVNGNGTEVGSGMTLDDYKLSNRNHLIAVYE